MEDPAAGVQNMAMRTGELVAYPKIAFCDLWRNAFICILPDDLHGLPLHNASCLKIRYQTTSKLGANTAA